MYVLSVKGHFDAAHHLPFHQGKCQRVHGHRWEVEVFFEGEEVNNNGILVDFGVLKDQLNKVLFRLDHFDLNERFDFNPTAENIATWLYNQMKPCGVKVQKVKLWESPDSLVEYWRD